MLGGGAGHFLRGSLHADVGGGQITSIVARSLSVGACLSPATWGIGVSLEVIRPRGVTASTLDSESSDRGSNPREAF